MASTIVERGFTILRVHPILADIVSPGAAFDRVPPAIADRKLALAVFQVDVITVLVIGGVAVRRVEPAGRHFLFAFFAGFSPGSFDRMCRIVSIMARIASGRVSGRFCLAIQLSSAFN